MLMSSSLIDGREGGREGKKLHVAEERLTVDLFKSDGGEDIVETEFNQRSKKCMKFTSCRTHSVIYRMHESSASLLPIHLTPSD